MNFDCSAYYVPKFGSVPAGRVFNNFYTDFELTNLIRRGANVNLYAGFSHNIGEDILAGGTGGQEVTVETNRAQQKNSIYGKVNYSFFDFSQINLNSEYLRNRLIDHEFPVRDHNYDKQVIAMDYTFDSRYSSLEIWEKGMQFIYPERGCLLSVGCRYNRMNYVSLNERGSYECVYFNGEYLRHPRKFLTIAFLVDGESRLSGSGKRTETVQSRVIGTFDHLGDYTVDGRLEIRYLHNAGLFWETPAFWYVTGFLLKFSPGVLMGYNGGTAGTFSSASLPYIQSLSIAPLLAVRLNGVLQTVLRFDAAVGSSRNYRYVISFNFGDFSEKPSSIKKQGIK